MGGPLCVSDTSHLLTSSGNDVKSQNNNEPKGSRPQKWSLFLKARHLITAGEKKIKKSNKEKMCHMFITLDKTCENICVWESEQILHLCRDVTA